MINMHKKFSKRPIKKRMQAKQVPDFTHYNPLAMGTGSGFQAGIHKGYFRYAKIRHNLLYKD
jgi:hypothetical protein